jgi:hypothetical protein
MNTPINATQPLTEEEIDLLALDTTITPPPLVRQTNTPKFLTYENEVLVDQDGNPTTPEQHNTTHAEILGNIRKHRHLCFIKDDDNFLALLAKYLPQVIKVEMPKLERTNRPKIDLGFPQLEE